MRQEKILGPMLSGFTTSNKELDFKFLRCSYPSSLVVAGVGEGCDCAFSDPIRVRKKNTKRRRGFKGSKEAGRVGDRWTFFRISGENFAKGNYRMMNDE